MFSNIGGAASSSADMASKGYNLAGEFLVTAGDATLKGLDVSVPWVVFVIGWLRWMLPLVAVGFGLYKFFLIAQDYWMEGKPSEYVLHVRNGKLIKQGVGISTWTYPGDQLVSFPCQMNQVTFKAEQVTTEMQGMQVTGILIWSPYREGDGPLRLWKAFGKDLQAKNSPVISKKISNMAMSIIRDKIANMTIEDILKKRQMLKDQIKTALQEILTNWGIWMETIEISDVRICSGTLFGYM